MVLAELPARTVVPILALKLAGRIDSKTKFQKLIFLAKQENKLQTEYTFDWYFYGPFSRQLAEDLDMMIRLGLIETEDIASLKNSQPIIKTAFSLTNEGQKIAITINSKEREEKLKKVIDEWNVKELDGILKYVYGRYKELMSKS